jgi:hypothetical protein
VVVSGRSAGLDSEHLPLCVYCLALLLEDPRSFWERLMPPGD